MLSPLGPSALTRYANGIAVGGVHLSGTDLPTIFPPPSIRNFPFGAASGPENYPEDGSIINWSYDSGQSPVIPKRRHYHGR